MQLPLFTTKFVRNNSNMKKEAFFNYKNSILSSDAFVKFIFLPTAYQF